MADAFFDEMKRRVEVAKNSDIKELAEFAVVVDGLCKVPFPEQLFSIPPAIKKARG